MRFTVEAFHHTLSISVEHDDEPEDAPDVERHDTTLDALVERAGVDRDPAAELDQRPRMGYRP